jgi:predicted RNase H-like HicB family nuclease
MIEMKYLVVVEKSQSGYGAYVPDLPGCIAAAESRDEVVRLIRKAMQFHVEGLKEAGDPVPKPSSQSELIEIHAA